MSMPQPIHVALIGSSAAIVGRAASAFRLGAPGIGAAYLVSLEASSDTKFHRLSDVPVGLIHLWVALDRDSLAASRERHRTDANNPKYGRGYYDTSLPEACVLVDLERFPKDGKRQLAELAQRIIKAWEESS